MVNYFGVNFFTVQQQKMVNSIEWKAIQFVYRFHGTRMLKPWPNGQMFVLIQYYKNKSIISDKVRNFNVSFIFDVKGQTGFPWIDAIMTQLREEGWIHHLARHAVACFLTRYTNNEITNCFFFQLKIIYFGKSSGDLWISWEEGMKVFDELLLDADWAVNAGMWMWLSSSSFFQQFFHCYCPVRFGRRADPNGDFIRKYLPILKVNKKFHNKKHLFNFFFLKNDL